MTRQANAAAVIGTYTAPRASSEIELCPGKCGDVVRFFVATNGYLEAAPCSTCARRSGKPAPAIVRKPVADADEVAQLRRDLGDVLLFFTTNWSKGTSWHQKRLLKQRVAQLAAEVQLPELLPAGWVPPHLAKDSRYVKTPAREAAAKRVGLSTGLREHRCQCGFITRGNVAWGKHRKQYCPLRAPDPAPQLELEASE